MTSLGEAVLDLNADYGPLKDSVGSAKSFVSSSLGTLGSVAGGVLAAGVGVAVGAFGALTAVLGFSISEAMEAQAVQAQLSAVLKSTGGAAGVTADMANDLATSLSKVTRFSDEAVLSGESMLLTFTGIGKDVFPAATQVLLDMSQAMGTDLQSSAIQLGKALNNPAEGLSALTRVGVTFTEQQKEQVKAMVAAGDVAGAQAVILAELQKEFGGSAEAAGKTFAGQLDILKNKLSNVFEDVGTRLLPLLTTAMTAIAPIIENVAQRFADWLSSPAIQAGLQALVTALQQLVGGDIMGGLTTLFGPSVAGQIVATLTQVGGIVTGTLLPALASLGSWFTTQGIPAMQGFGLFIQTTLVPAVAAFSNWIVANWPQIQATIAQVWAQAQPILQAIGNFIVLTLIPLIKQGVDWVVLNWPQIQATIETVINAVQSVINTVLNQVIPFVLEEFAQIKGWVDENWPLIQATIETVINAISAVITAVITAVAAFWEEHHNTIETVAKTIWENIKLNIDTTIHLVEGIIKTVMQLITGDWEGAWTTIKETAATLWEDMKKFIDNDIKIIKAVITDVVGSLKAWWATTWDDIKTKVETIIGDVLKTITTKVGEIKAAFTNIDWAAVGIGIISGIAGGIGNAVGGLVSAAVNAAVSAFNAAKAALGISSPSKLFAGIGENMMLGMAQGILGSADMAQTALLDSLPGIQAGLQFSPSALANNMALAGAGVGNTTSVTQQFYPASELDIMFLAQQVAREIQRRQ